MKRKKHPLDPARKLKRGEYYILPEELRDIMNRHKAKATNHRFSYWNRTNLTQ